MIIAIKGYDLDLEEVAAISKTVEEWSPYLWLFRMKIPAYFDIRLKSGDAIRLHFVTWADAEGVREDVVGAWRALDAEQIICECQDNRV